MLISFLKRAALGFLIGILMGDGIAVMSAFMSGGDFLPVSGELAGSCGSVGTAFLIQTVISGLYGAVCFGGITLYELERWPLALASLTHCLGIVLLFYPVAICLGWFGSLWEILIMSGIQVAVYFFIWLILYIVYSRQVRELNELQKHIQDRKNENR